MPRARGFCVIDSPVMSLKSSFFLRFFGHEWQSISQDRLFLKVASSTNDNQTTLTLVIADIDTSLSSKVEFLKSRRIVTL